MWKEQRKTGDHFTGIGLTLLIISCAVFLFEITLTRLFAIAHFYHFAFLIISLALLGNGASGSFLAIFPNLIRNETVQNAFLLLCACCGLSILGSYLLFNHLPFDAYAVAIDPRQFLVFLLHFLALSMPFFFTGMMVNGFMRTFPEKSSQTYAVNLGGSALGCLLAPLLLPAFGGEGVVCLCAALTALPGLVLFLSSIFQPASLRFTRNVPVIIGLLGCAVILLMSIPEAWSRGRVSHGNPFFDLYLSPYKALAYALQYPGARIEDTRWNAFSRVDVVRSKGIRSLPGLSYIYPGLVTAEAGLFVDGDDLSPILAVDSNANYAEYLPQSLAYRLRPTASVIVLGPRGGLDLLAARAGGASVITAVEPNPLLVSEAHRIYSLPNIIESVESPRAFLRRGNEQFDIIILSLASSFHPVTSGAYSLGEDFRYTVESIRDALMRLKPDGLLVFSRWLQVPPSEFLRAFILSVEALEDSGMDPAQQIVAMRGYNLGTLIIKRSPFTAQELKEVRTFAESRAFDLVMLPGLQPEESNRFNILPEDDYYFTFTGYLNAANRTTWLRAYPYDVSPPTDNRPFFSHFFKWSQIRQVLASYGKTWQPFGGAGYLVIVFLLLAVILFSVLLILLPVLLRKRAESQPAALGADKAMRRRAMAYFLLLGFAFMAVELPLIQKFILYLGQPAFSFSAVLFALLLSSGLGSHLSKHISGRWLIMLGLTVALSPLWLNKCIESTMGWTFPFRLVLALFCLSPLGLLMGIAFPKGIAAVQSIDPNLVPWLWAVNGVSSVVASVLSAMLALSFGFHAVLAAGGCGYLLAYGLFQRLSMSIKGSA